MITLGLIGTWQVFDQVYIMSQGQPGQDHADPRVPVLPTSFPSRKWGQGAAIAFILFAIIVVFSLFQRFVMRDRKTLPTRRRYRHLGGHMTTTPSGRSPLPVRR